jgi:hypothetical protein
VIRRLCEPGNAMVTGTAMGGDTVTIGHRPVAEALPES